MRTSVSRATVVMILAGGQGNRLYPLTKDRAKPAVPFGGAYRIIDFTLSNCLNSGLARIFMLTQYRSISLHRHVQNGWTGYFVPSLDQYIDLVPPQQRAHAMWYRGTADAIYQNIYILEQERPDHVVILSGDHIYRMDYAGMLDFHLEQGAALTVACIKVPRMEAPRFGVMEVDDSYRIVEFAEKPDDPKPAPTDPDASLASMGIYVFNTDALVNAVIDDARQDSAHDFGKNIIPSLVASDAPVYAFPFHEPGKPEQSYWRDIGTLESYYEANMDLLKSDPPFDIYRDDWPIRTFYHPLPPARLLSDDRFDMQAENTLISPGASARGATVRNSVISPRVVIGKGARVEDSVIFNNVRIEPGAVVSRAIIDKDVTIPAGRRIDANKGDTAQEFTITESGIAVIPKGMYLS